MDKVQKYNSFNTNTPSSESYRNYLTKIMVMKLTNRIYTKVKVKLSLCLTKHHAMKTFLEWRYRSTSS
jgi:hypothetical protein